jgi:hypothetical protein
LYSASVLATFHSHSRIVSRCIGRRVRRDGGSGSMPRHSLTWAPDTASAIVRTQAYTTSTPSTSASEPPPP